MSPSPSLTVHTQDSSKPPFYTIDLSLPPRARHKKICHDYAEHIKELAILYDEALALTRFPRALKYIAKRLLRKVYSAEENEEIRGIMEVTGLERHLLIAYNTFLDLFSGCMSGGSKIKEEGLEQSRMVHFRNSDWEMEPLRAMIIGVEYVREGVVIARAITYAGYLGTLTGVREGLSMSFNSRAGFSSSSSVMVRRYHQTLMLMGLRPSIASHLRRILLAPGPTPALSELALTISKIPSCPCYLIFCSTDSAMSLEKDLKTAAFTASDEFIAVTNHDKHMDSWDGNRWKAYLKDARNPNGSLARDVMSYSVERKEVIVNAKKATAGTPSLSTLKSWLETKHVTNQYTHFSCIMDPSVKGGGLLWMRAYGTAVNMLNDSEFPSSSSCSRSSVFSSSESPSSSPPLYPFAQSSP